MPFYLYLNVGKGKKVTVLPAKAWGVRDKDWAAVVVPLPLPDPILLFAFSLVQPGVVVQFRPRETIAFLYVPVGVTVKEVMIGMTVDWKSVLV